MMRSPVFERLMVRGSQVALNHVTHDMVARTMLMELCRRGIKRCFPSGDMDCRLKFPHSAKANFYFNRFVMTCSIKINKNLIFFIFATCGPFCKDATQLCIIKLLFVSIYLFVLCSILSIILKLLLSFKLLYDIINFCYYPMHLV